ncbi:hypothetical protein ACVWW1_008232 [Bradyrhizobium sp. JR3.5]
MSRSAEKFEAPIALILPGHGLDQFVIGRERLFLRCGLIVLMGLVEIDVVGLQPPQRVLDGARDVVRLQADIAASHVHADLGGEDDAVAVAAHLHPLADDRLGLAAVMARHPARIDVGRIEERQSMLQHGVEQAKRRRLVHRPAEHIAAEAEGRDGEAGTAERAMLHECSFSCS